MVSSLTAELWGCGVSPGHSNGNIAMRDEGDGALQGDHPSSLSASVPTLSKLLPTRNKTRQ